MVKVWRFRKLEEDRYEVRVDRRPVGAIVRVSHSDKDRWDIEGAPPPPPVGRRSWRGYATRDLAAAALLLLLHLPATPSPPQPGTRTTTTAKTRSKPGPANGRRHRLR